MLDFEHEGSYILKPTKVTKNIRLRLVLVYVSRLRQLQGIFEKLFELIEWFYFTREIDTRLLGTITHYFYCFLLYNFDYFVSRVK